MSTTSSSNSQIWTPEDDRLLRVLVEHGHSEAELQAEFPQRGPGAVAVRIEHLGALDGARRSDEAATVKMLLAGGIPLDRLRATYPHLPMSVLVELREELGRDIVASYASSSSTMTTSSGETDIDGNTAVGEAVWARGVWAHYIDSGPDVTVDDIVEANGGEDFGATREKVEATLKKIVKQLVAKLIENGLFDEREIRWVS